jgi:hypothetical protein
MYISKYNQKILYEFCKLMKTHGYKVVKRKSRIIKSKYDSNFNYIDHFYRNQYKTFKYLIGHGCKIYFFDCESRTDITELTMFADNRKCFNKPSDCFIKLPLPKSDKQFKLLLEKLKWLGSSQP